MFRTTTTAGTEGYSLKNLVNAFDRETWDDAEKGYFAYVDRVIAKRKNERFSNGWPWHAAYLIFKFLRHATDHVRIFSGVLVRETPQGVPVYGEPRIIEAACGFLEQPDAKLHIALEGPIDVPGGDPARHPLIEGVVRLKEEGLLQGTLEVRTMLPEAVELLRERGVLHHMMLMDERGWRLEVDPNPNDVKAIVNAGNAKEARALCRAFDTGIWGRGRTISHVQPEV